MKTMKKIIGLAMLASAAIGAGSAAHAEGTVSGNVALVSDYMFRGISQTDGNPAIQGGFDYSNGLFYAGVWGSNVDFAIDETVELDAYLGVKPTVGPVSFDFAAIGYFYPGAGDDGFEYDYMEAKAAASISATDSLTFTGSLFYSPEFFGETGEALYYEIAAGLALSDSFGLKASYGVQDVDAYGDSYYNYAVGATYALHGFTLGVTYTDSDAFDQGYAVDESAADGGVFFSIARAL